MGMIVKTGLLQGTPITMYTPILLPLYCFYNPPKHIQIKTTPPSSPHIFMYNSASNHKYFSSGSKHIIADYSNSLVHHSRDKLSSCEGVWKRDQPLLYHLYQFLTGTCLSESDIRFGGY